MIEPGLGDALEKLIEVLQLEGHELFEVFVKAQCAIGIANLIGTFVVIATSLICGIWGYRLAQKMDWGFDEGEQVFIAFVIAAIGGIIMLLLSVTAISAYLHIFYPEYTAAKELIYQIHYLIP